MMPLRKASLAAIAFTLAATCLFAILSVRFMPVGEFVAIIMLVPVIVTLISANLFRERVRPTQQLFLLVGFASLLLPWGWSAVDSGFMWLLMVAMGAMGAVSHFLLALAYQRAPATEVVPYMHSQVGSAVLFGWIVFGELPATLAGTGIVLIIL